MSLKFAETISLHYMSSVQDIHTPVTLRVPLQALIAATLKLRW